MSVSDLVTYCGVTSAFTAWVVSVAIIEREKLRGFHRSVWLAFRIFLYTAVINSATIPVLTFLADAPAAGVTQTAPAADPDHPGEAAMKAREPQIRSGDIDKTEGAHTGLGLFSVTNVAALAVSILLTFAMVLLTFAVLKSVRELGTFLPRLPKRR